MGQEAREDGLDVKSPCGPRSSSWMDRWMGAFQIDHL